MFTPQNGRDFVLGIWKYHLEMGYGNRGIRGYLEVRFGSALDTEIKFRKYSSTKHNQLAEQNKTVWDKFWEQNTTI